MKSKVRKKKKKKIKKKKEEKKEKNIEKAEKRRNRANTICSTSANFDFGQFDFGQLAEVELAEVELAEVEHPRHNHPRWAGVASQKKRRRVCFADKFCAWAQIHTGLIERHGKGKNADTAQIHLLSGPDPQNVAGDE